VGNGNSWLWCFKIIHEIHPQLCDKMSFNGFIISHTSNGMTTIPTTERIEQTKCSACARDCVKLCTQCGKTFCTKHLLEHSEKCSGYKAIVRSILHDDLVVMVRQVIEVMLRSV
jgi:hypothetical protein